MDEDYILIKKMLTKKQIFKILELIINKNEQESKVGQRVAKEKKIRKDIFLTQKESKELDKDIFYNIQKIVKNKFEIKLNYRESYKIGTYYGDEKGFYIPHTDTQGSMQHRKISMVICLSKSVDYQGGIFKLVDLNKQFKFDIGDAIIFKSNILHGVEPVIHGIRQVLVSFMWDEDGEHIRQKNNPAIDNLRYLPKNNT